MAPTAPALVSIATVRSIAASMSAGGDDLVADQPPLGAVAFQPPLRLDQLPRQPLAGKAGQAQIGGTRNDALLRAGKVMKASAAAST